MIKLDSSGDQFKLQRAHQVYIKVGMESLLAKYRKNTGRRGWRRFVGGFCSCSCAAIDAVRDVIGDGYK